MNNKRGKRGKRLYSSAREPRERSLYPAGHVASKSDPSVAHRCGSSTSAVVMDAAKYYDHTTIEETKQDHIIPRQSLTAKHFLALFPQSVEVEPVVSRQLDKLSGKMIETTDNRLVWKSDKTLLNRNKPGVEIGTFKREGSITQGQNTRKTLITENCNTGGNAAPLVDTVLGSFVDVDMED